MAAWISKHFIQLSKTLKWLSGIGLLLAVVFGLLIMTGVFDSRTRRQLLNRQPEQSAG